MATKKSKTKNKHRWDKFCLEYVKDFDRTRAYKAAGYKVKSDEVAKQSAYRLLLTNVYVQEKISKLLDKQKKTLTKDADDIIRELEAVAFTNITDCLDFDAKGVKVKDSKKLPEEVLKAISEVSSLQNGSIKIKLHNKIDALTKLGLRYKLFPTNIKGDLDVNVTNLADIAALMRGSKKKK